MAGARVGRMTRSGLIPRSLHINDLCKAWYRGMPISFYIFEGSHKAENCPFKEKCMRCREGGHLERDCINVPNAWVRWVVAQFRVLWILLRLRRTLLLPPRSPLRLLPLLHLILPLMPSRGSQLNFVTRALPLSSPPLSLNPF